MGKLLKTYKDLPHAPITYEDTFEAFKTGSWRTFRPICDDGKCKKCWICWKFCPDASIIVKEDGSGIVFDYDHCKGCGICVAECPSKCITMVPEE